MSTSRAAANAHLAVGKVEGGPQEEKLIGPEQFRYEEADGLPGPAIFLWLPAHSTLSG